MSGTPLPFPSEAELLAATGYPSLPLRVRYRPPLSWHPLRDGHEVERYPYTNADGETVFESIRFHPRPDHAAAPDKAFLWRHLDSAGRWHWGLEGVETVPYRLPRIRAAAEAGARVFVVEGEKDVHALEALGLTATTGPLGALQWTETHAEGLRGAEVVVIPDADRTGRLHAARVIATLRGRARSVSLLLLPVGAREDVSDWISRGNGAAGLSRLADAAPRDPSAAELASLLDLPAGIDPLTTSPVLLRALLASPASPAGGASASHPAFWRTSAVFARLGVTLRPAAAPPPAESGVPEAHATYRAVVDAIGHADPALRPLLEDASLLERGSYELGLFGRLLLAATGPDPSAGEAESDPVDAPAFATAPSVRLVRTGWDWDAFLADPAAREPSRRETAWALQLARAGHVQAHRLQPLPALLLEACARPLTRDAAVAAVAGHVDGDPGRLAAVVHAQIDALRASGFLRPFAPGMAEHAVGEMLHLLRADAPPPVPQSIVGLLARSVRPAREYAGAAAGAPESSFSIHRLDDTVRMIDQLLANARLRPAFSAELDGYWAGEAVATRVAALAPLLEVLDRALEGGAHRLPPCLIPT